MNEIEAKSSGVLDPNPPTQPPADHLAQDRAIKASYTLGAKLARDHPGIIDIYRESGPDTRFIDIAGQYIPDVVAVSPLVAMSAVGKALKELLPPEERSKIRASLRGQRLELSLGGFNSAKHLEYQRQAAIARHDHGEAPDPELMIKANGYIPWTPEERRRLLDLVTEPDYQHTRPGRKGTPNSKKIAEVLNQEFHAGENIRSGERVLATLYTGRRRNYQDFNT